MVKLIGSNKIKTAVFISGTGSNLKNLIQFSFLNKSPIKISLIVSNNKRAKKIAIMSSCMAVKIFCNNYDLDFQHMPAKTNTMATIFCS